MKTQRLINETIQVDDDRWFVWEARSMDDALNCIAHARCLGSYGGRDAIDHRPTGGKLEVIADVIRVRANQF